MEKKRILSGSKKKKLSNEYKSIKYARRGNLCKKRQIEKFKIINSNDIIALRPSVGGISVKNWNKIIGKKINISLKEGDIILKRKF